MNSSSCLFVCLYILPRTTEALEKFRDGEVNYLLCTDLASRGLDIKGVETVINYHFPQQLAAYIHRVGRTARAGLTGMALFFCLLCVSELLQFITTHIFARHLILFTRIFLSLPCSLAHALCSFSGGHRLLSLVPLAGRSVTLVGEQQRMLLKEVVKRAPAGVKSRSLPDAVIAQFQHSIETNEANVAEIGRQERMEKEMRVAEMHANKANNLIAHDQEIMSRPAKTWFQVGTDAP